MKRGRVGWAASVPAREWRRPDCRVARLDAVRAHALRAVSGEWVSESFHSPIEGASRNSPDRSHLNHPQCRRMVFPMGSDLFARASVDINAPLADVWNALVDPETIKQYMFGTNAVSDWKEDSPVTWKGERQGKPYEDKGVILQSKPPRLIQYSHFSPLSGLPDVPENYHTVTIELTSEANRTRLSLSQDNNPTEESRDHSQQNLQAMLAAMKALLEK